MAACTQQQQQQMNDFLKSQGLTPNAETQKAQESISKDWCYCRLTQ